MASVWTCHFCWRTRADVDGDCLAVWQLLEDIGQTRWTSEVYDDERVGERRLIASHEVSSLSTMRDAVRSGFTTHEFPPPVITGYSVSMYTPADEMRLGLGLGISIVVPFETNIHGVDGVPNTGSLTVRGRSAPTADVAGAYFAPLLVKCVRRLDALLFAFLDHYDDAVYYADRVRTSNSATVPSPGFMFYINREHYDPLPPLGDDARVVDIDGKGSLVILNHEPWSMENDAVFEAIERVDLTLQKAGVMRQPKYLRGYVPDENLPGWPVPPDKRGFFDV